MIELKWSERFSFRPDMATRLPPFVIIATRVGNDRYDRECNLIFINGNNQKSLIGLWNLLTCLVTKALIGQHTLGFGNNIYVPDIKINHKITLPRHIS